MREQALTGRDTVSALYGPRPMVEVVIAYDEDGATRLSTITWTGRPVPTAEVRRLLAFVLEGLS